MGALDEYIANDYVQSRIEQAGETNFTCQAAEESILRRMLKSQDVAEEIAEDLTGKDFSNLDYGRLFNAIQNVVESKRGVDMITVGESIGRLFPKNAKRLRDAMVVLSKYTGYNEDDARNVSDHVKIVRDLSARRRAIQQFEGLIGALHDPRKDIGETLAAMESAADGIDADDAEWEDMGDVLIRTFDYVERRSKGEIPAVTTGIGSLDKLIGGFFAGEMTIVAARPSVGKSAFGLNAALAAASDGFKVAFVSCEMSAEGVGQRLLSHGAWVDGMALRKAELKDDDWAKLTEAMNAMGGEPVSFMFECNTVEDVVKMAKAKARHKELDLLIVDYLQFMDTKRTFREERHRVGYISRKLKQLAKSAKIPVIVLSQVTREGEGAMPTMKMLRESGDIEQDADGIIFLHRPTSPEDKSIDPRDKPYFTELTSKDMVYLCIGVAKQRNAQIGQTCIVFDPTYMRYVEISRDGAK